MLLPNSVLDYHLSKLKKSKFRNRFTLHTKDYEYLEKLSSKHPVNVGK
ncbi:MAG: hypothetical protein ACJZ58_02535 [Nitrososphaerales archaeon]